MKKLYLYGIIFICGLVISFCIISIYQKYTSFIEKPSTSSTEQLSSEEKTKKEDFKIPNNTMDDISALITNEIMDAGDIDVNIDTSLPNLELFIYNKKSLKEQCEKKYPRYNHKNRYRWALEYTLSKTENPNAVEFYMQDEVFSSFTSKQKKELMKSLLYCDKSVSVNPHIKQINLLSVTDDSILASYERKS